MIKDGPTIDHGNIESSASVEVLFAVQPSIGSFGKTQNTVDSATDCLVDVRQTSA